MKRTPKRIALALLAPALGAFGCGSDDPTSPASETVENNLVFERPDGGIVQFTGDVLVWCGPWEGEEVPAQALHILVGSLSRGDRSAGFWWLRAVVEDVAGGTARSFPNSFVWNEPKDVEVFIVDPPNELTTSLDGSSGAITFSEVQCTEGGTVEFEIDAVIASEFADGPSVHVSGTFRAPVASLPSAVRPWVGRDVTVEFIKTLARDPKRAMSRDDAAQDTVDAIAE